MTQAWLSQKWTNLLGCGYLQDTASRQHRIQALDTRVLPESGIERTATVFHMPGIRLDEVIRGLACSLAFISSDCPDEQ